MASSKTTTMAKFGLVGMSIAAAAVVGSQFTGTKYTAPAGSDVVVDSPTGKDIVYQLAGTEITRETGVVCTATGGTLEVGTKGGVKYNTCVIPSPLTTTGALTKVTISCGNVAKALIGTVSFMKTAVGGTGSALPNGRGVTLGTGALIHYGSGYVLWNPADSLKFGTPTVPTGTLSTTRYNCTMRATIDDIYGR